MYAMKKIITAVFATMALINSVQAEDAPELMVGYVSLDPEIVTNYITESSNKLGFIRVNIELMIADIALLPDVEMHLPLLRASVIENLGQQPESRVRSQIGREDIRIEIQQELNGILQTETGITNPIKTVLFTKYLHQQ